MLHTKYKRMDAENMMSMLLFESIIDMSEHHVILQTQPNLVQMMNVIIRRRRELKSINFALDICCKVVNFLKNIAIQCRCQQIARIRNIVLHKKY